MPVTDTIRKLSDAQTASFDEEYVAGQRREIWERHASERFDVDEEFHVLDVGGGNGAFADMLLDSFPRCQVTVLDNSAQLLQKNRPHPRKQLVNASAENVATRLEDNAYDLACFNWVLHHLVTDSYAETQQMVARVLADIMTKLKPSGRISVFENMYQGMAFDDLPGKLIYALSSSRALAPWMKRLGANTAGVGVCFHSRQTWLRIFRRAQLQVLCYDEDQPWRVSLHRRALLHIRGVRVGHFWLAKPLAAPSQSSRTERHAA